MLGANDLRYPSEVSVSRDQNEVVFEHQRCDPKMVVGHRSTGPPQLNEKASILFRRLPAGQQNGDSGLGKQPVQQAFVGPLLRPTLKSGHSSPNAFGGSRW